MMKLNNLKVAALCLGVLTLEIAPLPVMAVTNGVTINFIGDFEQSACQIAYANQIDLGQLYEVNSSATPFKPLTLTLSDCPNGIQSFDATLQSSPVVKSNNGGAAQAIKNLRLDLRWNQSDSENIAPQVTKTVAINPSVSNTVDLAYGRFVVDVPWQDAVNHGITTANYRGKIMSEVKFTINWP